MVTKVPSSITLSDDIEVRAKLSTAERWFGATVVCVMAIISSVATCAMTYGRMTQRMDAIEQRQNQNQVDHDTLTRLDERVAWLCQQFGKKD